MFYPTPGETRACFDARCVLPPSRRTRGNGDGRGPGAGAGSRDSRRLRARRGPQSPRPVGEAGPPRPYPGSATYRRFGRRWCPGVEGWEVGDTVVVNPALWCGECEWCELGEHPLCVDFKILGEHVAGGTAERVRVTARNLYRVPPDMDFRLAAAAPLAYQTAWRALTNRGRLRAGETVLVTGASGGVSTAAIQIAGLLGARVIAVTSGPENVRRVFDLGADVVLDRLEGSFAAAVREHTGGRGVDLVIDSVGEAIWADCLRCLSRMGRLVTYGATTGARGTVDIRHMFWKQNAVLGSTMASGAEFEEVMGRVVAGDLVPVVGEVLPLDSIRQAHELLERGEVFGQLVLDL